VCLTAITPTNTTLPRRRQGNFLLHCLFNRAVLTDWRSAWHGKETKTKPKPPTSRKKPWLIAWPSLRLHDQPKTGWLCKSTSRSSQHDSWSARSNSGLVKRLGADKQFPLTFRFPSLQTASSAGYRRSICVPRGQRRCRQHRSHPPSPHKDASPHAPLLMWHPPRRSTPSTNSLSALALLTAATDQAGVSQQTGTGRGDRPPSPRPSAQQWLQGHPAHPGTLPAAAASPPSPSPLRSRAVTEAAADRARRLSPGSETTGGDRWPPRTGDVWAKRREL